MILEEIKNIGVSLHSGKQPISHGDLVESITGDMYLSGIFGEAMLLEANILMLLEGLILSLSRIYSNPNSQFFIFSSAEEIVGLVSVRNNAIEFDFQFIKLKMTEFDAKKFAKNISIYMNDVSTSNNDVWFIWKSFIGDLKKELSKEVWDYFFQVV
jgi:hypothetical protein